MADKRVLFVINMQEYYVGRNRDKSLTYPAVQLLEDINNRISEYDPEMVYYIVTVKKGLFGGGAPKEGSREADLLHKLNVASKNIYQKNKPDAFTNVALEDVCRARMIKEVEMVGVDAVDVYSTAIGAIDCGMRVIFNDKCIYAVDMSKSQKAAEGIDQSKVTYI